MDEKRRIARKELPRENQAWLEPTTSHSVRKAASTGDLTTPELVDQQPQFHGELSPTSPSERWGGDTAVNGELESLPCDDRADERPL